MINSIYYQDIRTYDTATEMFQREMEQRMVRESEVLYSAAIYDADGSSLWHSEKLPDRNKAEVKQEDWFQNAQKNIEERRNLYNRTRQDTFMKSAVT